MGFRPYLIPAGVILVAGLASCAPAGEGPPPPARLSRDYPYWRGEREKTPGPFLCAEPAAAGVTVVSDRWPDGSDLRQFGLDAVRLSGAKTDHQKALAVWRWVRRWTMYTDGNPPTERLRDPSQSRHRSGYIDDPLKVLDVYGAHWCDGLSRVVEAVWRSMGYRAEKLARAGHTMVICNYRDHDDASRWHWFDVSEGRFLFDRTGRRLLTLRGHRDRVTATAFGPDGMTFASASADGTVRVWLGDEEADPALKWRSSSLHISGDGPGD